jgi:hypothetical protein
MKSGSWRWSLILNILLAVLILAGCESTPTRPEPPDSSEEATIAIAGERPKTTDKMMIEVEYDNETFAELVSKYASEDGLVDYGAWKQSPEDLAALNRQVDMLARISPATHPSQFPDRSSERSYWINTYNTLVLQAVLDNWPLESVQDVKISFSSRVIPGKGFFYDRKVIVGGEETNLYNLEKEVLRTQKDPRLHFALNCASSSCPVLRPWEWTEEQLDQAAREFINKPENVSVQDHTVYLSRIFKWYKKDFPTDAVEYVQRYAEPELQTELQAAIDQRFPTRYFVYDWDLNDSSGGQAEQDGIR